MSSEAVRLTVVTDNAERASLAIFGFRLQTAALEAPWCRFLDRAYQIPGIPDDAAVVAIWFDQDPLIEVRWFNERHKRRFNDDWAVQGLKITEWLKRREEKELALIASAAPSAGARVDLDVAALAAKSCHPEPSSQPRTMWS